MSCEEAVEYIPAASMRRLLLLADHASNHVPDDVRLEIPPALLDEHVAVDIGAAPLSRALARRLGCAAILGGVSRLVVDFNREADEPNVIPVSSDGHAVPGNAALCREQRQGRIDRYWKPYHGRIEAEIAALRPGLLVGIHSFTPRLASRPHEARPWQIGILYNRDERAARIAIPLLRAAGIVTGDNEPYSGRQLNATMNRHAEARGLPYLGIEVRQDLIADRDGVAGWTDRLAPVIAAADRALACGTTLAQ